MCDCQERCEGGSVSRREFLAGSSLAVLGSALASGCGNGYLGAVGPSQPAPPGPPPPPGSFTVRIANFASLANVGGVAFVNGAAVPLVVVRTGATSFDVFNRKCPHNGTQINQNGTGFRCPNHGALFALTGKWTGGYRTNDLNKIASSFDSATGVLTVSVKGSGGGGGGGGNP